MLNGERMERKEEDGEKKVIYMGSWGI